MSQERPERSDTSVEKIDKPITDAQKERKRQKNKARREKRRQAKSFDKKDDVNNNDTSDAKPTTPDTRSYTKTTNILENGKKGDSKSTASNPTNRKKGASKKRKRALKNKTPQVPERVTFKLTVRRLPPNLKEDSFWNVVYTNFPDFKELVHSYYYVNGYLPQTQFENPVFSRCYIDCIDEQSMMIVGRGIKTLTFTNDVEGQTKKDETGNSEVFEEEMEVYVPSIEKSFYQKMPQGDIEPFPENGSITKNPHYKLFVELLKEEGRREMPRNIFDYIIELKQKKKSERRKQKKANAKVANLKNDKTDKPNEKNPKVNDTALKKTRKKKPKKKVKSDDKQAKPNSSSSDERKPIKFTLKKKSVA
ncbi:hypothetical protein CANINC_002474 [Pichia inconspicua]|uniref:UPF3 domain-containing protein n=1 Tax=Pichia inconspicua TaxID=52247 RepID=A0A4T0X139_9ASCO|nr:hypothetical protein CANINC_002474 [[Candida] inconspicua]